MRLGGRLGVTPYGLSPEGAGEPWKDFEQGRDRVRCELLKDPSGCYWRVGGKGVGLEPGPQGGGWVGTWVGEMGFS